MEPIQCNLLAKQPSAREAEVSEPLLTAKGVRMERITSLGQASPEGFWFDQEEAEWVMLLAGGARLTIEGEVENRQLQAGDAIFLPSGCRHRVAWTDPDEPTIWLALFLDAQLEPSVGRLAAGGSDHAEQAGSNR